MTINLLGLDGKTLTERILSSNNGGKFAATKKKKKKESWMSGNLRHASRTSIRGQRFNMSTIKTE